VNDAIPHEDVRTNNPCCAGTYGHEGTARIGKDVDWLIRHGGIVAGSEIRRVDSILFDHMIFKHGFIIHVRAGPLGRLVGGGKDGKASHGSGFHRQANAGLARLPANTGGSTDSSVSV
jgi:hypothetical protein